VTARRRVDEHSAMTALERLAGTLVVLALVAACGPTAEALHPTLPPRASHVPGTPVLPSGRSGGEESTPPNDESLAPATTPSGSATAPSAPAGSATPASSATPPPPGIGEQITGFPATDAFEVTGVVPIADGFLAVGFGPMPGQGYFGLRQGIVWTSTDGTTWQESVEPAFANITLTDVVTLGSDIYVFGDLSTCDQAIDPNCVDNPTGGTVVYRSSNGGGWEQLQQTPDMQRATFDGVKASDSLLVAWGSAGDQDETTTLWTSSDGLAWTAATDLAGMDPVDAAAAGGPGLLAFGTSYDDQSDQLSLIGATSSNGSQFTAATVPSVPTGEIDDIANGPSGYVGVGYAESDVDPSIALALSSADGLTWTQSAPSDNSFENALMSEIHPAANEYVAVGSTLDQDDPTLQTLRAWASADGHSWRSAGDIGGPFTQYGASALGSNGLVVFTADQNDIENGVDVTSTINAWLIPLDRLTP